MLKSSSKYVLWLQNNFNDTGNLDMVKTLMERMMQPSMLILDKMDVVFVSRVLSKISYLYDFYNNDEVLCSLFSRCFTAHGAGRCSVEMNKLWPC